MKQKVIVAMSGGVDSSMTMILLKKEGYDPIGVTLQMPRWNRLDAWTFDSSPDKESLSIAKQICKKIGAPHIILSSSQHFKKNIINNYFKKELKAGNTPNPCIICNKNHKLASLIDYANSRGIFYIASGHYARNIFDKDTNRYILKRPKDKTKDQTYGLCLLNQDQLKRLLFPLGNLKKEEVFKIAASENVDTLIEKKESQDLCFMQKDQYQDYIKNEIKPKEGYILDQEQNIVGKHKGLAYYTIGQKKGLSLKDKSFVLKKDKQNNEIIITKQRSDVSQKIITLYDVNFISGNVPKEPLTIKAKTNYRQQPRAAELIIDKNKTYKVIFDKPQESVSPGQFCVFYDKDTCLGGGIILG